MAAYISVPRDLTRVKSKILFGLTKRQIVCFGTGALIGVPVYFFVRGSGNLSALMRQADVQEEVTRIVQKATERQARR